MQLIETAANIGHQLTAWYLTSHQAHLSDQVHPEPAYAKVARTKKDAEIEIRHRAQQWHHRGIRTGIASADVITDSVTTQLMERLTPGALNKHRLRAGGTLPTTDEVAQWVLNLEDPRGPEATLTLMTPYRPTAN